MCGRYKRHPDKQKIADAFKVGKLPPGFELPPDLQRSAANLPACCPLGSGDGRM
jgi:hypothetical protein